MLARTVGAWIEDDAGLLGAGLATYALLSLAPFLLIVVQTAGLYLGEETASSGLRELLVQTFGPEAQKGIGSLVQATRKADPGWGSTVIGITILGVAATRLFAQLQAALHILWGVRAAQHDLAHRVAGNVARRLMSFGLVVFSGVLLVVAVSLQSVATRLDDGQVWAPLLHWASNAVLASLLALTISLIYKWLPCVKVRWVDVIPGSLFTSALLVAGKFAIGFYMTEFASTSAYGLAGASILVMLWMVYSFQIFLMGAEFTRVWLHEIGQGMTPRRGWALLDRHLPAPDEPHHLGEQLTGSDQEAFPAEDQGVAEPATK